MHWLKTPIQPPDAKIYQRAWQHQQQLTKPPGSLGKLEQLACRLAAMQRTDSPAADYVWITVFAADHGITQERVSAFPQSVTAQMVSNFAAGGAAINVLARQINAHLEIVDVGVVRALKLEHVIEARAGNGTDNFLQQPAMSQDQLTIALQAGKSAVERALLQQSQIFIGGEMGIGNTTSAAAVAAALTGMPAADLTGAGTGLDQQAIVHKTAIIEQALQRHQPALCDSLAVLQCVGGFEITALTGAFLAAAMNRLPVLVDGFIASVASLAAVKINADALPWFLYAHHSQEKGHRVILEFLNAQPLVDLHLRLGEGSGAAVVVPLLRSACALHNGMATFGQAQVSSAGS